MPEPLTRLNAVLSDRYRVERELGEGGMATVYLAQDLKHERKVALKVLKPELAAVVGAERFLAEIRTTANLQHPNILPLFDSGEAGGVLYYVMPYIEGESLRDLLNREVQLGVETAVRITRSVAGALQAAHDEGVIHRDIKPENILLSRGEPVVADFGIALAVTEAGGGRLTETGLSLGTPYYMSPEQAAADRNPGQATDIYSLGCVLYEMLAGEPPFTGATAQAVLARILTEDPRPISAVRRTVPPNVANAVDRALERLPADRFERADDFARALADPGFQHRTPPASLAGTWTGEAGVASADGDPATGRGARGRGRMLAGGVALLVAGLALGAVIGRISGPEPAPERTFQTLLAVPAGQTIMDPPFGSSLSISDDGQTLVYAGSREGSGSWQLWIRRAGLLAPTPVPGSEGAYTPVLAPDGNALAFAAQSGELVVVDLVTGARRTVVELVNFIVDWSDDDHLYFADSYPQFFRVPAGGGAMEPIAGLNPDSTLLSAISLTWTWGEPLPGGTHGVWTRIPGSLDLSETSIGVLDLATGDFEVLAQGSSPRFLKSGHLAWTSAEGMLQVAPFDPVRREVTGIATPLVEGVRIDASGAAFATFSQHGDVVYRTGGAFNGGMRPVKVDFDGTTTELDPDWSVMPAAAGNWSGLALSPDGSRIITTDGTGGGSHLWVKDLAADAPPFRITFDGNFNVRPRWSAGGDTIFYISAPGGITPAGGVRKTEIWARAADGSGVARPVLEVEVEIEEVAPSPAGEWLVYRQGGSVAGRDIFATRLDGEGEPIAVAATEADEKSPQVSPDGRWVAYVSDATGRPEVFVRPFPDVDGGVFQISRSGGRSPVWSRDGARLYYLTTEGGLQLIAARLAVEGRTIRPSDRTSVFQLTTQYVDQNYLSFDVLPRDQGFVFYSIGEQEAGDLVWYRNWLPAWRTQAGQGGRP